MAPHPELAEFVGTYDAGRPQVVWTSLVADLETPVSAMLKLAAGRPYSLLLESVEGGAVRGRYSGIGLKPDLIWRCYGERAEINRLLTGTGVGVAPGISELTESIGGAAPPDELDPLFQLTYLYFTEPHLDSAAFERLQDQLVAGPAVG